MTAIQARAKAIEQGLEAIQAALKRNEPVSPVPSVSGKIPFVDEAFAIIQRVVQRFGEVETRDLEHQAAQLAEL